MPTDEAFRQAIIEDPDDDAPRLVYADWLDEHDNPVRAEFIRIQCSLAGMPGDDPRRSSLQQREQELLQQYGWVWAEEMGPQVSQWMYRRGFIEAVEMGLEAPPKQILAVLQKAPIRQLRDISQFCDFSSVVEILPHLDGLVGLEFLVAIRFRG